MGLKTTSYPHVTPSTHRRIFFFLLYLYYYLEDVLFSVQEFGGLRKG